MKIKFKDAIIDVNPVIIDKKISKYSKTEISKYSIEVTVAGIEDFKKFQEELIYAKRNGIYEIDTNGETKSKYKVNNWLYTTRHDFSSSNNIYTYKIDVEEEEMFSPRKIIIEGMEIEVLKYSERYDKESLIIYAVLKMTEQQRQDLYNKIGDNIYFSVLRPEISNDEIIMRHGKVLWSKHEGYIKRKVVLVEKCYDKNSSPNLRKSIVPEMENIQQILAKNKVFIEEIVNLLVDKKVLTNGEINSIKETVEQEYKKILPEYYMVEDAETETE